MEDFNWQKSINVNLVILRCVGLWPKGDQFYEFDLYSLYAALLACLGLVGYNLSQLINVFFVYTDLEALTEIIFISTTNFLATAKTYFFVKNLKLIKQLFTILDTKQFKPKTQEQLDVIKGSLKIWKIISFSFVGFTYLVVLTWCINPVLKDRVKLYELPFRAWYPFEVKKSPNYEITYAYQMICMWPITTANVNLDTLFFAFMLCIKSQLDILCDDLKNIKDSGTFNEELLECIKHHKAILRFAEDSNQFFNMIVLAQIGTSTAVLALAMFELTLVSPVSGEGISDLGYITGLTTQILMYCKYGNEITLKSREIVYSVYQSNWLEQPKDVKDNVLIFCTRCQNPIEVTALNLFTLSLQTFIGIMRTAWSYFAVLQSVSG